MRVHRWFIYELRDPITWDVRYVGKTIHPRTRLIQHCTIRSGDRNSRTYRGRWIASLLRRGLRPLFAIIDAGLGLGYEAAERAWISELRRRGEPLTNATAGGEGAAPRHLMSEETRLKLSRARLGVPHSDESKRRMSDTHRALGRKIPPELRARLTEIARTRVRSPEELAKMAAAHSGIKQSAETKERRASKLRGRQFSPERRKNIANAKMGHSVTAETREKIAESLRGQAPSEATRAKLSAAQKSRRARERLQRETDAEGDP